MSLLLAFAFSLLGSLTMASWCAKKGSVVYLPDFPVERSLHKKETSRSGGLAILFGIIIGLVFIHPPFNRSWMFYFSALSVFIISFLDDIQDVFWVWRLCIHIWAAALVVLTDQIPHYPVWFIVLGLVWMTNLFNFMDGMDGFAGSQSLIGFSCLTYLGWTNHATLYTEINAVIVATTMGFLWFNLPPAKLFMGDGGACFLGFCAGSSSLIGVHIGATNLLSCIILWSPFLVDASVTLLARVIRLEKIWIGQRNHFYHKLLLQWGHRKTWLLYFVIMIFAGISALWTSDHPSLFFPVAWAIFYALFFIWIHKNHIVD